LRSEAGIVDENVDSPEGGKNIGDQFVDLGLVRHVNRKRLRPATSGFDFRDDLLEPQNS
jgi:hypothetical protein